MSSLHDTAAEWFARLHAPDCSDQDRQNFKIWYHKSSAQAQAYDLVSTIWQASGASRVSSGQSASDVIPSNLSRRKIITGAVALAVGSLAVLPNPAEATICVTGTGQQKKFTISRALTVLLDSDSSVAAREQNNILDLLYGQAEITSRLMGNRNTVEIDQWKISLSSGNFNFSKSSLKSSITVLKGRAALAHPAMGGVQALVEGERATILPDNRLLIDRPSLDDILAWRSGRLSFRNTPLSEAADEMNRYARRKLEISASAANLRISGFYHFGQNETFARLLENFLPVRATFGQTIEIVKL